MRPDELSALTRGCCEQLVSLLPSDVGATVVLSEMQPESGNSLVQVSTTVDLESILLALVKMATQRTTTENLIRSFVESMYEHVNDRMAEHPTAAEAGPLSRLADIAAAMPLVIGANPSPQMVRLARETKAYWVALSERDERDRRERS